MRPRYATILILLVLSVFLTSCAGKPDAPKLAPMSTMPDMVKDAPASVRTAYQFAVANPEALANVPCYCGCGSIGHHSNLACYVKDMNHDGKVVFDNHALGCSICVDIALDVMKMTGEGKSPSDIHAQIVSAYSSFGPANQ